MIRRFLKWLDNCPSLHKHDVSELSETYQRHSDEGFTYTTVHYTWWCPICKRSWKQWGFLTNQDRQIERHIYKLKVEKLQAQTEESLRKIAAWQEELQELLKKVQIIDRGKK